MGYLTRPMFRGRTILHSARVKCNVFIRPALGNFSYTSITEVADERYLRLRDQRSNRLLTASTVYMSYDDAVTSDSTGWWWFLFKTDGFLKVSGLWNQFFQPCGNLKHIVDIYADVYMLMLMYDIDFVKGKKYVISVLTIDF